MKQPKKLTKQAKNLLATLECHLEACTTLSPKVTANSIVMLLAGSLSLSDELHDAFAKAGYVTDRSTVRENLR